MLSIFQKAESLLLSGFVSVVMLLSIGLAMMVMVMVFALIVTLASLMKLVSWKEMRKNERTGQSSRWRPLQE